MTTNYITAYRSLIVNDWPIGGKRVGKAIFEVESNNRGERITRTTTGKPKTLTYGELAAILVGDDGKTYCASKFGDAITIYRGTMDYQYERITISDDRYTYILELMKNAN